MIASKCAGRYFDQLWQNWTFRPLAGQCNNEYGAPLVSVSGGIQSWTVPATGTYRIEAFGAREVRQAKVLGLRCAVTSTLWQVIF